MSLIKDLIEKLVGNIKEGKYIKKKYMQMVLSSSIQFDKNKIEKINQSQKQNQPLTIIEKQKLRPDASFERLAQINPLLGQKYTTLENIKEEQDKYKSLMQNHKSLNELLRDEEVTQMSERSYRKKINEIIQQNQSFEMPNKDVLQQIKNKCFDESSKFNNSSKLVQAQIRIKALANGLGLDQRKSANGEKRSMLKTLNDRIRQQNTSSLTNSIYIQHTNQQNSLEQTIIQGSLQQLSRNIQNQNHQQGAHTKNNKSQVIMGSQTILNVVAVDNSNDFTRQNTSNISDLLENSSRKPNRFKEPQVPEVQIKSKSQNFEIKLKNMEMITSHENNHLKQKNQQKLAKHAKKYAVGTRNKQSLGQLLTIMKQNSRNQDEMPRYTQIQSYQQIKQTLQNDSFKVDNRKSRVSRVQSKSYLQSHSLSKKLVSQDTEITQTFYQRLPQIQPLNNSQERESDIINFQNAYIIKNKRQSVYDKIRNSDNSKQENLILDFKHKSSDMDSQADKNSSQIGGFMSKQTSFSRIQGPTYINNMFNIRNSSSFMDEKDMPIEIQLTRNAIASYRRRASNDSSNLSYNYYADQVIPNQKQKRQQQVQSQNKYKQLNR